MLVSREGIGYGPEELQTVLAINFFKTLVQDQKIPGTIFFYGEGIKLNTIGSIVEESLLELEKRGSQCITCTTCLNFFQMKDQLLTGRMGTMGDLARLMEECDKVIQA